MTERLFVILKEDSDDLMAFGHVARRLTLEEARAAAVSLATRYPDEKFHIFADCGAAVHREMVCLDLKLPDLSGASRDGLTLISTAKSNAG